MAACFSDRPSRLPRAAGVLVFGVVLAFAGVASADDADPEKAMAGNAITRPKVKKSVLLASANMGLLVTSGNSNVTTFTGGAFVTWKNPSNRFTFDGAFAYASQHVLSAADGNGDGVIQRNEILSESTTGAQNWFAKPRYDRYLTEVDSIYVSGAAGSDVLAGKQFLGGGQVGYSRILLSSDPHEVIAEGGYDFTHERYVESSDSLNVHSARLFTSYKLKLADDIFTQTALEVLTNVLPESTPTGDRGYLADTRVNWKNLLSAKVWRNISGRFSFTAKYDNVPAPRPEFDLPYADGVVVPADKLDTQTEFAVVVNFL